MQAAPHTAGVEKIELRAKKADHLPAGLQVVLQPTPAQSRQQRRNVAYCRDAVWGHEANETFGLLLDQCSLECNDVEPTSHLHVLTAKVTKAAETAFANDRAKKRQPWMSPITYAIVVEAKQVSKRLRRTGRWIARSA